MSKKFGDLQSQHTIKLELQIKLLLLYMPCRGSEPCFVSQTQNKIETPKTPPTTLGSHPERRDYV